jgi:hypothetical protein
MTHPKEGLVWWRYIGEILFYYYYYGKKKKKNSNKRKERFGVVIGIVMVIMV